MTLLPDDPTRPPAIGILLSHTGTPESPTPAAVRRYLAEFLADPRIIAYPRWLWLPLLHGVILQVRPRRSARLYSQIWTEGGSPLLATVQAQASALRQALAERIDTPVRVAIGMRYGEPSIPAGLRELRRQGAERFLVLPLFPQYSGTTTASAFDAVSAELKRWRSSYPLRTIQGYHDHPAYIRALVDSLREHLAQHGRPERLLFSFHGIPQSYDRAGDPYADQCRDTASRVVEALGLEDGAWQISFQSRFGPQAWLQPYSDDILRDWGSVGVRRVGVFAPGFSVDCLETLYEIDVEMRATFIGAGGQAFDYIPALNARPDHVQALAEIIVDGLGDWVARER